MLKVTNKLLMQAAEKRGWKVEVISEGSGILRYYPTDLPPFIAKSLATSYTTVVSKQISDDKYACFKLAKEVNVDTVETFEVENAEAAIELLKDYPQIVIKPSDAAHGDGITVGIKTPEEAKSAFAIALEHSTRILAQPMVSGKDVRVLIIGNKLAAASVRHPASVIGDGEHSLVELIDIENNSGRRAPDYKTDLNLIDKQAAIHYLADDVRKVPQDGEEVIVVGTANIGTGGKAEDITDTVSDEVVRDSIKVLNAIGLETGAADFIVDENNKHWLLELNSNPSLGLHAYPTIGQPRNVADLFLDWVVSKMSN